MKVILIKIGQPKQSRHGGSYIRVVFRGVDDNKSYRLDVYSSHPLSRRWTPYLSEQSVFQGVNILPGTNIIDGTSPFVYVGRRHIQNPIS